MQVTGYQNNHADPIKVAYIDTQSLSETSDAALKDGSNSSAPAKSALGSSPSMRSPFVEAMNTAWWSAILRNIDQSGSAVRIARRPAWMDSMNFSGKNGSQGATGGDGHVEGAS